MTYDDGLARLLQGDALDVMAAMPECSVDCIVTSPPYWGLRLYSGEQERVWNGVAGCEHAFKEDIRYWDNRHAAVLAATGQDGMGSHEDARRTAAMGAFCQRCGAWRGSFGNEPSVALYIAHLMEFMVAIKRVLKDTGVCFINLDDSHSDLNLAGVPQRFFLACQEQGWIVRSEIILAKDSSMPESLRGWFWARHKVKISGRGERYQRAGKEATEMLGNSWPDNKGGVFQQMAQWADCPGCEKCAKNGGMVLRKGSWRPTSSHEKLFMLTKGEGYYGCGEDVRIAHREPWRGKGEQEREGQYQPNTNDPSVARWVPSVRLYNPNGANLRDVWPMKSSAFTMQLCKSCKRVYTGAQFGRLANTADYACADCGGKLALTEDWEWQCLDCARPYSKAEVGKMEKRKLCRCGASDWLSHFAAFHPSLPTTCILASTSPKGNCSNCGLPWVRVIETVQHEPNEDYKGQAQKDYVLAGAQNPSDTKRRILLTQARESQTLGWKPSCSCGAPSEPAVVLDPFSGTASTGVAAKRLGRRYIGIDTSSDYLLLSAARLAAETAGML